MNNEKLAIYGLFDVFPYKMSYTNVGDFIHLLFNVLAMRKTCLVIQIFLFSLNIATCLQVKAQNIELMFTGGMAGYSMSELKKLNTEVQDQVLFNTKLTENFPMTFQFGGHFAVLFSNNYKLGLIYAFNSTGSRIASSDYSGSYRFDNVVRGQTIGILNGFRVYDYKVFRIDFQANLGFVSSNLKIEEELIEADTTISSSANLSELSIFLEPRAEFSYQWKHLKLGLFIGYFINPLGKIQKKNNPLSTPTINWSGIRLGIEFGLTSGTTKQRSETESNTKKN